MNKSDVNQVNFKIERDNKTNHTQIDVISRKLYIRSKTTIS